MCHNMLLRSHEYYHPMSFQSVGMYWSVAVVGGAQVLLADGGKLFIDVVAPDFNYRLILNIRHIPNPKT